VVVNRTLTPPAETIAYLRRQRAARAKDILELRKLWRKGPGPERALWIADMLRHSTFGNGTLIRVTPLALKQKVKELMRFAKTSWESHDTEYYSACGWDDACSERRHQARLDALDLTAAARWLVQYSEPRPVKYPLYVGCNPRARKEGQ